MTENTHIPADEQSTPAINSFEAHGLGAIERLATAETILEVKDLSVTLYTEDGALPALQDVSFSMRKGETLAVVGESGCGKSMTALALMGQLPTPPAAASTLRAPTLPSSPKSRCAAIAAAQLA
jgi:predicted ABC-type transport system involved in lysophospholipase L1 biosynthesis ATPase subunit